MIRSFIAVEIDPPKKQKLSALISNLKTSEAGVKWVNESQMHLTLKFLGDIKEEKVREISDTLKSVADTSSAFSIRLSSIGAFPNMHKPRVIWIDIDKGKEELKLLAGQIENELEKSGFTREKRGFKAHLTLGRVKSLKNISNLIGLIKKTEISLHDEIEIKEIILFRSTLKPTGAIYTPISRFNLKI